MNLDKNFINTYNKQKIIHLIMDNPGIYCAKLAKITGLSIPAVMKITEQFVNFGLVNKAGKMELQKGKYPETFELNTKSYYIIGVDVGTTVISAVLMDLASNIKYKFQTQTSKDHSPSIIFGQINNAVENILSSNTELIPEILGVGIGFAGIIVPDESKIEFSPAFRWKDIYCGDYLDFSHKMPVIIENVTKSMAIGEKWFGEAKNVANMICVNLGYGIGSALMINEEIHGGDFHASGELGHMVMEKDGPLCDCGNYGCLEALASAKAIAESARSLLIKHPESLLNDYSEIECKTVFECAEKGDKFALSIVDSATSYIGTALANVINLLDINLIILEGGMTLSGKFLTNKIKSAVEKHIIHFTDGKVNLKISKLGQDAVCIGAATLILKNFIENGLNTDNLAKF